MDQAMGVTSCHPPTLRVGTASPAALSEALSAADILEGLRRDEFEIHFQPKVEAATLRVVGVEALARWRHPHRHISPDDFIVAAEQHGVIAPLSEVLLLKALTGGAKMLAAGHALAISVNVSAHWLTDARLPDIILAGLEATGLCAENLILEITETSQVTDAATALLVMHRLQKSGCKLSIDDFGVGHSSLEQLQRYPFSELKLDRTFIRGAAEKPFAQAILISTLDMAAKLNLSTVAEGVETQADLDLMRGLGCDLIQGWRIAPAMSLTALLAWLAKGVSHYQWIPRTREEVV